MIVMEVDRLDVHVDVENLTDGIRKIVSHVRPHWNWSDVNISVSLKWHHQFFDKHM